MKTINDIINWIVQSGLLVWAFYFALAIGKPFVESKAKHAKTAQQREAWELLEQVAMTTVNALVSSDKTGQQKFDQASTQVATYLSDRGIHIDMKDVQTAVQAAYEKSDLTSKTESVMEVTPNGVTTKIGPAKGKPTIDNKSIVGVSAQNIPTGRINTKDMPGAEAVATKPYNADNAKQSKGIPMDNLKDVAVQAPQQKEGATNAEN
ncbi:phage holin, LLH family [Limosilactobacillus sp.]|uniref:phage holin, LLH family n=1 Tax=Limosilactobacillus sp. TaxID=2773925 RepID=UPI003F017A8F